MPRKKQLKVNGSAIARFSVEVKSEHAGALIDFVDLEIIANDDIYRYYIFKDDRFPDIHKIRGHIEDCLTKAKKDFLNVEISEFKERKYLFFNVQSICEAQYTGYRV